MPYLGKPYLKAAGWPLFHSCMQVARFQRKMWLLRYHTESVGFPVLSFPPLAQVSWLGEFQKVVVEATKSFRITESWIWKRPKKSFIICIFPSQIEVTELAACMTCGQSHLIYWSGWKSTTVRWMQPRGRSIVRVPALRGHTRSLPKGSQFSVNNFVNFSGSFSHFVSPIQCRLSFCESLTYVRMLRLRMSAILFRRRTICSCWE